MNVDRIGAAITLAVIVAGGGASFSTLKAKADTNAAIGKANAAVGFGNTVAIADLVEMLRADAEAQKLAAVRKATKDAERIRMTAKFCAIDGFRVTNAVQCAMNVLERESDS